MEQPIEKPADTSNVHVPRATFNYFIIAVAFLVLGIVIGAVGYDRFVQANAQMVEASVTRALNTLIESQGGSAAETTALNPNERYDIPVANNPSQGSADAPVTIVEFSDFRCGFCGRFARETLAPLLASYDESEVQFVYRDFVIFGQQSYEAALASECAHDQDKFWEFHDLIFANQQTLNRDQYLTWADENGLDVEAFTTCYDSETHREEISADLAFAQSLGLTGTPTFFINGRAVSGAQPVEVFRSIIDEELANAGPQVPSAG